MRNRYFIFILAIFIMAFTSCNVQGTLLDPETTAQNLTGMRSILTGLDSMLALGVESGDDVDFARTIDPNSSNADIADLLQDGSGNALSPSAVYSNFGGTGDNEVRVPESGYFDDYYTSGMQAYFKISPESGDIYRIKLYVFPRTDFAVKYDYEEYLVDESATLTSWAWENMNDNNQAGELSVYKTYFSDGTAADRTIEFSSVDGDGNGYADEGYGAFSVPSNIIGNSDYDYPDTVNEPSRISDDNSITWSSHTKSAISSNHTELEEFYTELGDDYSGIMYRTKAQWWNTGKDTVTRYEGNLNDGTLTSRSLTTTGNSWDIWETETKEIAKGMDGGKITYSSIYDVWWSAPSEATGNSSYRQVVSLTETGIDTNSFSGEMTEYWGSFGGTYNLSLTNNNNGTYTLRRSGWSSASRSVDSSDLTLVVNQRDDMSFTMAVGNGTFSGNFVQGSIEGTYSENGSKADVTIDPSGITVDGSSYKYSELAE